MCYGMRCPHEGLEGECRLPILSTCPCEDESLEDLPDYDQDEIKEATYAREDDRNYVY